MDSKEYYIEIKGVKLWVKQFIHSGGQDQAPFILLHDALGSVAQWKDFPRHLAQKTGRDVILYDRPGHGRSAAYERAINLDFFCEEAYEILPALVRALAIDDPILYGHSDGGTIALLYAARHPVTAVIAEAAHIFIEEETYKGVLSMSRKEMEIIQLLRKYHGNKAFHLFDFWSKAWTDKKGREWNIERIIKGISAPVLIIQGKEDEYASDEQAYRIMEATEGPHELLLLDKCRHFPYKELPDQVLDKIQSFLLNHIYIEA